jgi:hypothetical protein
MRRVLAGSFSSPAISFSGRSTLRLRAGVAFALLLTGVACRRTPAPQRLPVAGGAGGAGGAGLAGVATEPAIPSRVALAPLADGEVYVYAETGSGAPATKMTIPEASAKGLLIVELGDGWAPFIFQDGGETKSDPAKPNAYRKTFVELANDRIDEDGKALRPGEGNFLEPFGIPPSLSVLASRIEADRAAERRRCEADVDRDGIRAFQGLLGYQDREHARREHAEALRDSEWLPKEIARREEAARPSSGAGGALAAGAPPELAKQVKGRPGAADVPAPPATWKAGDGAAALTALAADADPKVSRRVARTLRGQERLRAVRALQAFLLCEGLLSPRAKTTPGSFDLPTHEALAAWERRNDIFGWGMLGGETQAALLRPTLDLDYETFRRVLAERVADAAGIVEDGSTRDSATYQDAAGETHPVPNLIEDHLNALLASLHVSGPGEMIAFLRQHGAAGLAGLRVAFRAPPLPPYYDGSGRGPMDLSAVIDRGDVWYDFPFDAKGRPVEQPRSRYPHLMLFTNWRGQHIPLVSWRTTIGSWRSELHANGKVYYRYKNSDVGGRVWKDIVAGPVWIPPDGTPVKDLLTRKVLDREKGPETLVNTGVMGPGFQSAYGLVMAIHINQGGFDNQIRTHGSVDYTSIARRFSHGCHRLVNDRAVRLFDFVLRHRTWKRIGDVPLHMTRQFTVDGQDYRYKLATRGYYYRLDKPVPVTVTEGRVMGQVKKPIADYVRKAGVDYDDVAPPVVAEGAAAAARKGQRPADPSSGDATASPEAIGGSRTAEEPEANGPSPTPLGP